jgi:hypothetical protein
MGGQILYRYAIVNGIAAAIPPEARTALEARPEVAEIVDDQRMTGHLDVSVPSIDADRWWSAGYTGWNWDAAVVDSGVDRTHPGLSSLDYCESRSLATADATVPGMPGNDPTVDDVNGHGTHVAGIVSSTDSTYRGVAYGLDMLFNCKAAYDEDGSDGGSTGMYWSDAMNCVDWALLGSGCGDTADAVNLSYGASAGSDDSGFARFWDAVVDDLAIPVTISAGNSGPDASTVEDPCIAYNVVCVANMDDQNTSDRSDDTINTSSSRGPTQGGRKKPDLTAPGTDILSASNNWEAEDDWVSMSGATMAAPHVTGAQLLMTDYYASREPMIQKAVLINAAEDRGDPEWDPIYGWGYVDLWEADFNKDNWSQSSISPRPDYHLYKGYMADGKKATLVWHRRAGYGGDNYPTTYYDLGDLDLYLYREDNGSLVDASTSSIDNVEQVQTSYTLYYAVIKVDSASSSFDGAVAETYALATEEGFTAASGPDFGVGTSNYDECANNEWTVEVTVDSAGDLAAHNVQVSLSIPAGLALVSGENPQTLGTIASGDDQTASWTLSGDQAGNYTVPVDVSSRSYGEDFSGSASFAIDVTATPSDPDLIIPTNGDSTCDTSPTFDWSAVSGATSYRIQVDDDSDFSSPVIDSTTSISYFSPSSALPPTNYYWRVRAANGCGDGPWSSAWSVTIAEPPSTAPGLISPSESGSTCDTTPTFDWSTVSGATSYRIQVDDALNFGSPVIDITTSNSNFTPSSALAPGIYYWRVRAGNGCGDGPWSDARSFTILASPSTPDLISPSDGSSTCDATPTFDWSTVDGATSYQIQVDDGVGFSSPVIDATTLSSNFTPPSALAPGTYHWRVRAANGCGDGSWSVVWSVIVAESPSAAPGLISPANSSSTCDTTPTFDWAWVSGATSYRIQVDDDPSFSSPEIEATSSSSNFTPTSALTPDTYHWRVRADNACGDGPWSAAWSVTIVEPPSTAPGLISPANTSSTCDTTPTFDWGPVSGASSYEIQVDDDPSFGSPEIDAITSSSDFTPTSALAPGTYHWRVRAGNGCGNGPWSTAWSVTVLLPPSTAPGLIAPTDGGSTCDTIPAFDWAPVSGATSYQIQVDDDSSFSSPEIEATTSSSDFTPPSALAPDTYYWRVRAVGECGDGPWSAAWSVTVVLPPTTAPGLIAPADGSSTCDTTPTFDWSWVSGATSYQIQVDDDPSFGSPEIEATSSSSDFTPTSALAPGTYHWRVRAIGECGDGPWSVVRSITILTPPSISDLSFPSDGSSTCDTTPAFGWSTVSGATSYQIQVDDDPSFGSPEIYVSTTSSGYTPSSALPPGTYSWRVRAVSECGDGPWSAVWSITILVPPSTPELITPGDGASACDTTVVFDWSTVSEATSYQIQVDDDSSLGSPEVDITTSSSDFTPSSALLPGTYYWRVRPTNKCGNGLWSVVWNLTVVSSPTTAPDLFAPPDGDSAADATPGFEWSSVSGATSYQIQIDDDPSFGTPDIDTNTANPNYTPTSDLSLGTYYWQVRAANTCGGGPWSVVRSCQIVSKVYLPTILRSYP